MLASSVLPAFLLTGNCVRTGRSPQQARPPGLAKDPRRLRVGFGQASRSWCAWCRVKQVLVTPAVAERWWMHKLKLTCGLPQSVVEATLIFKNIILSSYKESRKKQHEQRHTLRWTKQSSCWKHWQEPSISQGQALGSVLAGCPCQGRTGALNFIKYG